MRARETPLALKDDPALRRFPTTARILDGVYGLPIPWRHPLIMWVAMASFPVWGSLLIFALFLAFIGDILFCQISQKTP